ncbi:hypothetical protein ABN034_22240 [Actinopolymorpha sp. B11F2]|uniref:hypothetical protein n=1 Tax=Actinopolymorpha sp. B11F2 TaxID=3160862 RepID=UPI0032E3D686
MTTSDPRANHHMSRRLLLTGAGSAALLATSGCDPLATDPDADDQGGKPGPDGA